MRRRPTATSAFGVSKRENHDSSRFYERFTPPALSSDETVHPEKAIDKLVVGDARHMAEVPDNSVALVVTSPPYFAGKEYEQSLGRRGAPSTYLQYLQLLRDVLAECARKLEPGGRMAVNVANLGRRPYRSLSADLVTILQDDLRLLLRGELIWWKQRGSAGSCAWGSFQSPVNPVLRDLTERVIVASKGRFDRAMRQRERQRLGLPWQGSMTREDFMQDTLDIWEIPAESATRVGHPAPFPVELPARLIELYTFRGDLVLDPFVGAGTTAVAAVASGRHYVGYDSDQGYVQIAEARVAEAIGLARAAQGEALAANAAGLHEGARPGTGHERAVAEGRALADVAVGLIERAGFTALARGPARPGGASPGLCARDTRGEPWLFEVAGAFTTYRGGLKRADVLWKALARAAAAYSTDGKPVVLMTTELPGRGSEGAKALAALTGPGKAVRAVVQVLEPSALDQLRALCGTGAGT